MEDTAMGEQKYIADWPDKKTRCKPVPFGKVELRGFLGKYVEQNLESLLFAAESALFDGFKAKAAGRQQDDMQYRLAADSDVYKWLEGACYVYARTGNTQLREVIDNVASLIVDCQSEDGYLNTQAPPIERFDPKINHELYVAGHFFEAAAAHHLATGKSELLDVACRWADYLIGEYGQGNPYFEKVGEKEHSEYELGFLRLSRVTGKKEYLDFAVTLAKMCALGPKVSDIHAGNGSLHAVRVGYLLSGLTDLYMETGDESLYQFLPALWRELVDTRSYVTGAVGSHGEIISTEPYDLPHTQDHPDRTMGETCSSISMIFFTWRMYSLSGESEMYDVIEKILLNHIFGALALNGMGTFYYNPMRVVGDLTGRTDHWHVPACTRGMLPEINKTFCCMPNCWRFMGALPEYVFSQNREGLYINLYTESSVTHPAADGNPTTFTVETSYPQEGKIVVRCTEGGGSLNLRLRIPGWCDSASIQLPDGSASNPEKGKYFAVQHHWEVGDSLVLDLPMAIRLIQPDPRVEADRGQVVFARGPLLYCLESDDVESPVETKRTTCTPDSVAETCSSEWHPELFGGIHTLSVPGEQGDLTLIPWYCRANRSDDSRWIIHIPLSDGSNPN